jgi:hypothetical protein
MRARKTLLVCALIFGIPTLLLGIVDYNEKARVRLRATNPDAYLATLKGSDPSKYLSELRMLRPAEYEQEMARTKSERESKIHDLVASLGKTANDDEKLAILDKLSRLDPSNLKWLNAIAAIEAPRRKARFLRDYPERFVELSKFSWKKGGFDTVMLANFTLASTLPFDVTDIVVSCSVSADSGTVLGRPQTTIYKRIAAGSKIRISELSLGFIHSQASSASCEVARVNPQAGIETGSTR